MGRSGELPVLRDALQIFDVLDAKRLVNDLDLGDTESGNSHQVEEAGRHSLAELIEIGGLPGFDQLADDAERSGSDAGRLRQLAGADQRAEVIGVEAHERACRAGVCPRLELLLAFYLEERADLGENVRGGA